ncbi:MAG: hypothetical protein ACI8UO_006564 [Verrucomicrobiales bacterium]|jgi:uncharacterized protein YrrD
MFRTIKDLIGTPVEAEDGKCGKCADFLFDDQHFAIRYLVVDVGGFFSREEVLISPKSVRDPDLAVHDVSIPVALTKAKIESSPPAQWHPPISQEMEEALADHYEQTQYWVGSDVWGFGPYPVDVPRPVEVDLLSEKTKHIRKRNLRSANEIMNYQVSANDGDVGSVSDFIVETKPWQIRYFVVDTGDWLPGKKVLLSPRWNELIRWEDKSVTFDLTRERIKGAPEFDPHAPVNLDYDGALHDYYGVPHTNRLEQPK